MRLKFRTKLSVVVSQRSVRDNVTSEIRDCTRGGERGQARSGSVASYERPVPRCLLRTSFLFSRLDVASTKTGTRLRFTLRQHCLSSVLVDGATEPQSVT